MRKIKLMPRPVMRKIKLTGRVEGELVEEDEFNYYVRVQEGGVSLCPKGVWMEEVIRE